MSLPPGFLDELRSRTSLTQVVGRKVIWDSRKSNQAKGDMWAPCPFHHEKTASFHVDDRKGFYYCFGCQAKGDAIGFVKETENVSFIEAVEILAREAGMEIPKQDPRAQQKADRRGQLVEVMEQAVQFFRLQLRTAAGAEARDYLTRRGLTAAALERWEIGLAPPGWQNLWDHLRDKGVEDELIAAAGLAKPSNKGGKPYDTFRNRIMFPIRDARGRAIAFGGRALDPTDNAKYLNSPETELFDKGRSLFNHGPARTAAGKGQPLVVAEGYMDVIALAEAGFEAAVAPLGTAITETQLQLLWRISDEPVIALDGDKAGLGAAMRLIDLALPLLEAGKSLRFALMPEGQDPDDLLRAEGAGAVQAVLDQAQPMVRLLWQRETEGRDFDSPERKAALDKTLRERIKAIRDPSIRSHYGQAIKDLRWELFRPKKQPPQGGGTWRAQPWRGGKAVPLPPSASAKSSLLVAAGEEAETHMREAVILATAIAAPELIGEFEHRIEAMACADRDHALLRDVILRHADAAPGELKAAIAAVAGPEALENLYRLRHVAISPCVRKPGETDLARMTLAEELAKLEARRGLYAEVAEAVEELTGMADEAMTWRLGQAAEARSRSYRIEMEGGSESVLAENGLALDKSDVEYRDKVFDKIDFTRGGRSRG
ncbi:DNA primase [Antarcticimicrobium luteum]|uniref:DNA primase n=1 Tax=Antarcticimicrobium luteum TaxID=2547397 RepID=A0A4R5VFV4_9RHOB|nr:DNA primase [Antarcticimicrobium luteum]TDK51596.1 DNA primase [Antarcticimicrobium luteum]